MNTTEDDRSPELTSAERKMITFVCQGQNNGQIAALLQVSESAIEQQLASIFRKLSVDDRLELIIYAYGHGLVPSQ